MPDEVVLRAGVETFDKSLDKAKAANDEASARLVKAIKGLQIQDRHISTDVLSVEIRYTGHHPPVIDGYFARRSYLVTLKDVKLFEKLVEAMLKNGANQLSGVEFRTTESRKHRDAARKMAIKAAKEKAQALAAELECKVARPRSISENYLNWYYGGGNYAANAYSNSQQVAQATDGGESGEAVPLGQLAIRAGVSVSFDLEP